MGMVTVSESGVDDLGVIMGIETRAFGYDKEARLVAELLRDKSAEPMLSLLAFREKAAVGHVLFTRARFRGQADSPLMHILAPLAVVPECQQQGIGGMLIRTGLELLHQQSSKLVFVLGHKEYYPRHGFVPYAARLGYAPPFPMPKENEEYWMVQSIAADSADIGTGTINCADTLNQPQHWREDETDR